MTAPRTKIIRTMYMYMYHDFLVKIDTNYQLNAKLVFHVQCTIKSNHLGYYLYIIFFGGITNSNLHTQLHTDVYESLFLYVQ